MKKAREKIALLFTDDGMGHPDYGWIDRRLDPENAEDACEIEDLRYHKALLARHPELRARNPRVIDGYIFLDAK